MVVTNTAWCPVNATLVSRLVAYVYAGQQAVVVRPDCALE